MLNNKAVFFLIKRSDYEATNYAFNLLEVLGKNETKKLANGRLRSTRISDVRKAIVKVIKDRYPKFKDAYISKIIGITTPAVRNCYIEANKLYSYDSNFQRIYDTINQL